MTKLFLLLALFFSGSVSAVSFTLSDYPSNVSDNFLNFQSYYLAQGYSSIDFHGCSSIGSGYMACYANESYRGVPGNSDVIFYNYVGVPPSLCKAGQSFGFSLPATQSPAVQCHAGCEASVVSASDQYKVAGVQSWVGVAQTNGNSCTGSDAASSAGAISSARNGSLTVVAAPPDCSPGQAPVALPTGWMSCKNPDAAGKALAIAKDISNSDIQSNAVAAGQGAASAVLASGGSASDAAAAGTLAEAAFAGQQSGQASKDTAVPPCNPLTDSSCLGAAPAAETVGISTPVFNSVLVTFVSSASCPAPIALNFSVAGRSFSFNISYQPFCDLATTMRPVFLALGAISAAMIFVAGFTI